ncbi:Adenylate cyclase [Pyrodictium delaneyi]|uniref:Adenylate cyclase n=1 Tax=Pyrodictium delaneyi TaxID=1273541 RepID=A0A0P0N3X4_9CREN|nr:class IV adenylate cyclase [Pyrodictium delaneyi]ALL00845.1 Adenylate cyclase [Pyrodictium delaneyi]OWJ55797.1 adenylate cyclase [Pyrodictium delaneyi]
MAASVEVEAKLQLASCKELEEVRSRLEELGAVHEEEVVEEDTYFQHPCRDFAETDEALRLRIVGGKAELTYKGPKRIVGGSKARAEYTTSVGDPAAATRILESLGFRPVVVVRKTRSYYRLGDVSVSLDRVEGLGCFLEAEYKGQGSAEQASQFIEEVLEKLGIATRKRIYKSYLELLLEKMKAQGAEP